MPRDTPPVRVRDAVRNDASCSGCHERARWVVHVGDTEIRLCYVCAGELLRGMNAPG